MYTLAYILSNRESLQASATLAKLLEAHYATQIQREDFTREQNNQEIQLRQKFKQSLPGLLGLNHSQLSEEAEKAKVDLKKLSNQGVGIHVTLTIMAHGAKASELSLSIFGKHLFEFLNDCDAWEACKRAVSLTDSHHL